MAAQVGLGSLQVNKYSYSWPAIPMFGVDAGLILGVFLASMGPQMEPRRHPPHNPLTAQARVCGTFIDKCRHKGFPENSTDPSLIATPSAPSSQKTQCRPTIVALTAYALQDSMECFIACRREGLHDRQSCFRASIPTIAQLQIHVHCLVAQAYAKIQVVKN